MPAAIAFCTSSKPARPLTTRHASAGGGAGEHPGAGDLVDGVVPPDVLAYDEQVAVGGGQAGRVHPAGAVEDAAAASRSRSGSRRTTVGEGSAPVQRPTTGAASASAMLSLPHTPHADEPDD